MNTFYESFTLQIRVEVVTNKKISAVYYKENFMDTTNSPYHWLINMFNF
jgi:hypothetical protein